MFAWLSVALMTAFAAALGKVDSAATGAAATGDVATGVGSLARWLLAVRDSTLGASLSALSAARAGGDGLGVWAVLGGAVGAAFGWAGGGAARDTVGSGALGAAGLGSTLS